MTNMDGVMIDENLLSVLRLLQKDDYRGKYLEALLKVMESYIKEEELIPEEQWGVIQTFARLRSDLAALKPEENGHEKQNDLGAGHSIT